LRKRWQPVLQAFQIARHGDADDVGPGGEELTEFEIGGAHPFQRARQARPGFGAAAFDQSGDAQRQLAGRRHQGRVDGAEHAFAREYERGAGQPRDVDRC